MNRRQSMLFWRCWGWLKSPSSPVDQSLHEPTPTSGQPDPLPSYPFRCTQTTPTNTHTLSLFRDSKSGFDSIWRLFIYWGRGQGEVDFFFFFLLLNYYCFYLTHWVRMSACESACVLVCDTMWTQGRAQLGTRRGSCRFFYVFFFPSCCGSTGFVRIERLTVMI